MWLLSWPKIHTCTTKNGGHEGGTTTASAAATKCLNATSSHCTCLSKLVRKLKKHRRMVRGASSRSQGSFQCRYDPLSYALNFDASGCGNLLDDQDYYKFCAFSSRFVANPSGTSCPRLIATTSH